MNTENKVFNKLFSSEKLELASEKFEFGVIQDAIKESQNAIKEFQSAASIVSSARSKAEPILKNTIALSNSFLNSLIERLDKQHFTYDIILVSASHHSAVSPIANFYPFLGVVLAFFLAVLTVIFRDKTKRK